MVHTRAMARPHLPEDQKKEGLLKLRLNAQHDRLLRAAAESSGLSVSGWMRDRLIQAARQELGLKPGEDLPE